MIKISPSVLAADLSRLADEVIDIEKAGADMVHLDVMDGVFVTNITFGLPVIANLRGKSDIIFDVHLMIDRPERYVERFIDAGADILTFHVEACEDSRKTLETIRNKGCKAAISVKPNTPVESIFEYLELCDMVLVMTVEPGYGGQALLPECLEKVRVLRKFAKENNISVDIQVDGGITADNLPLLTEAGANVIVAGSAIFKAENPTEVIEEMNRQASLHPFRA